MDHEDTVSHIPTLARINYAWYDPRSLGWLGYFLVFVPMAIAASLLHAPAAINFSLAAVAHHPSRGLDGPSHRATGEPPSGRALAVCSTRHSANAAELILALFALGRGLDSVVKASLTGSIIGNLLLVLGASLLAGGLKYPVQRFNRTAAAVGSTLLALASIGLIIPAMFHHLAPKDVTDSHKVSVAVGLILVFTYVLSLIFS